MKAKYTRINPDDFAVRDVINIINQNLDYLYGQQESSSQTVSNLIPYSDFSILSNVDYWKTYKDSTIAITDNVLCAFSSKGTVGVMTPAVAVPIEVGQEYTLLLRCRINTKDSLLNEFYIVDEQNNYYRVNHDQLISTNYSDTLIQSFTATVNVQNPRFIIGSADVFETVLEPFKYRDKIVDSLFIKDGLILPYIDTHKAEYDKQEVPLKDTIHYLLVNFNSEMYNHLSTYKSGDLIGTTYNLATKQVKVSTELETYLFNLLNLRRHLFDTGFHDKAIESLNFFASKYNESPNKGLFPIRDGSTDYSLRLSLIVLDAVRMFKLVHSTYTGTDTHGHPYSIEDIENSIVECVHNLPSSVYSSKYIKGGYRAGSYFYLDSTGTLSSSEVDMITQLELYRLFLECDVPWDIEPNIKSLMSYEFKGFQGTYLMPNKVKASDILLPDTSLTIDPAMLYFNLLTHYPERFLEVEETKKKIMLALQSIKSSDGYYKYDYSLGGYTYSSNQYLEVYLDGYEHYAPRTIYFDEITLFKGSNTNNLSVINATNGKSLSRVEYSIERVDTTLDATEVVNICSDIYATQESVSESVGDLETSTNESLDDIAKAVVSVEEDVSDLKANTTPQNIINMCAGTFYTKSEVDTKVDDTYVYINQHITSSSEQFKALSEKDANIETQVTELKKKVDEGSSTDVTALTAKITELETKVATLETTIQSNSSTIATLDSKVNTLTTTVQEQANLITKLQGDIASILERLSTLEGNQ